MITLTCCHCFIVFGMPDRLQEEAKKKGNFELMFYCPMGHRQGYGDSEIDKERRLRQRAEQEKARLEDEVRRRDRLLTDERNKAKRLAKRAAAGVCPCCHHTVGQMARHMKTKHPDYNVVPLKQELSA